MKIFGFDSPPAPCRRKAITVAAGRLMGMTLAIEGIERLETFSAFEALLARPGPWIGGFDFPFGLPAELCRDLGWPLEWKALVSHCSSLTRQQLRSALDAYRNCRPVGSKYAHRATDLPAGSSSPMKLVNPPVALMFHEGARRIAAAGVHAPALRSAGRRLRRGGLDHQLVALRAHAEARQARLLHELVAEGIAQRRGRPYEEAATLRVLHQRRPDRAVKPGAEARFAPRFLLAPRRVLVELLRRRVRLHPLHRRARSGGERGASDRMDSYNRPHAHSVRNVGLGQLLQGQAGARAARPRLPLDRGRSCQGGNGKRRIPRQESERQGADARARKRRISSRIQCDPELTRRRNTAAARAAARSRARAAVDVLRAVQP